MTREEIRNILDCIARTPEPDDSFKDVSEQLKQFFAQKEIFKGDAGEKGEKGEQGLKGEDGKDGKDGVDGKNGSDGRDGIDGRDGKDGKNISPKEAKLIIMGILSDMTAEDFGALTKKDMEAMLKTYDGKSSKSLEKRLNALQDAVFRNYGGHGGTQSGGATTILQYDLSSQLNGSTKSFTIPSNTAITAVMGSSAPFIFAPTTDYTGTGTTTITFTAGVDAPSALAAGQTLIVQYY